MFRINRVNQKDKSQSIVDTFDRIKLSNAAVLWLLYLHKNREQKLPVIILMTAVFEYR